MTERESIKVLREAIAVQTAKSKDYQNEASTVVQADYYPRGVATIQDILHAKLLRARSLIESGNNPSNEKLEDTYMDLINYASFAVAWLRGRIPGQQSGRDFLNRPSVSHFLSTDVPATAQSVAGRATPIDASTIFVGTSGGSGTLGGGRGGGSSVVTGVPNPPTDAWSISKYWGQKDK